MATTVYAMDIWNAWPDFVAERYHGQTPLNIMDQSEVSGAFFLWLLSHRSDIQAAALQEDTRHWLQGVVKLATLRRQMEAKAVLYMEKGEDTFADPEVRDEIVAAIREGKWLLGA